MDHNDIEVAWSKPLNSVLLGCTPISLDHHPSKDAFLVGSPESCLLYHSARLDVPVREWTWGRETIHQASFNPVEHNLVGILTKDNSIMLADTREDIPLRKVSLSHILALAFILKFLIFTFLTAKNEPKVEFLRVESNGTLRIYCRL